MADEKKSASPPQGSILELQAALKPIHEQLLALVAALTDPSEMAGTVRSRLATAATQIDCVLKGV